jgi:Protein of Unknown function (DUF2604)
LSKDILTDRQIIDFTLSSEEVDMLELTLAEEGASAMPDSNKQSHKIDLTVIVNGQPTVVEVNQNAPLEQVVEKALHQTHTKGQPPEAWELRDAAGVALDLGKKVGEFNFAPGTQLFLNLKAGVGG